MLNPIVHSNHGEDHNEHGSVVMASLIILVMLLVSVAVTDRVLANVRAARNGQARAAALSATDIAIAEAMARIDRGETASFSGSGVTASSTFQYSATVVSSSRWHLRADAQSGRAAKSVEMDLNRTLLSGWVQSAWHEVRPARYATAVRSLSGLQGYWRLDEPASATTAADWSGNGVNGTWSGTVSRPVSGALVNDADPAATFSAGGIDLGDNFDFPGTVPYTISLWIKSNPAAPDFGRLFDKDRGYAPTRDGPVVAVYSGGTRILCERFGNGTQTTVAGVLPAATWAHVACVYNGSTMSTYVNGALSASAASTQAVTGNSLPAQIGRSATGAGHSQDALDEFAIWNRALSSAEVAALYSAGI